MHNDLDLSNVIIDETNRPVIIDFSVANGIDAQAPFGNGIAGKPLSISPEKVLEQKVGYPSDIYSLVVMLYQLVTRRRSPFRKIDDEAHKEIALYKQKINEDPIPPKIIVRNISKELDALIVRGLSRDPNDRPQSAGELKEEFLRAMH